MKAIESTVDTYNNALKQNNTPIKESEELSRGIEYAETCYQNITRAIARVKAGKQNKENQDQIPQGIVASIAADIEGASRESMGQVEEKEELDRDDSER